MSPSREGWLRSLVRLSAAVATGDERGQRAAMEHLKAEGRRAEVEEAILQAYLFAGYPRALNALTLWRRVSGGAAPDPSADDWREFEARGLDICRRIYGGSYERLRQNVTRLHPDLDRWMVLEGYGKVLGRPGLDLKLREMCAVAALAALGVRPQLRAHVLGALNVGASPEEVDEWVRWLGEILPADRRRLLAAIWEDMRSRCS